MRCVVSQLQLQIDKLPARRIITGGLTLSMQWLTLTCIRKASRTRMHVHMYIHTFSTVLLNEGICRKIDCADVLLEFV